MINITVMVIILTVMNSFQLSFSAEDSKSFPFGL